MGKLYSNFKLTFKGMLDRIWGNDGKLLEKMEAADFTKGQREILMFNKIPGYPGVYVAYHMWYAL